MKIAFYVGTHNIYDPIVRIASWSVTSHVEIVFSNGQCFSSSGPDGGVRYKTIDLNSGNWIVIDLDSLGIKINEVAARQFCDELVAERERGEGGGYDWWGVFRFLVPFFKESPKDYFCSEVVAIIIRKFADWAPTEFFRDAWKLSPGDLLTVLRRLQRYQRGDLFGLHR